jgi:hypothetical protein
LILLFGQIGFVLLITGYFAVHGPEVERDAALNLINNRAMKLYIQVSPLKIAAQ